MLIYSSWDIIINLTSLSGSTKKSFNSNNLIAVKLQFLLVEINSFSFLITCNQSFTRVFEMQEFCSDWRNKRRGHFYTPKLYYTLDKQYAFL